MMPTARCAIPWAARVSPGHRRRAQGRRTQAASAAGVCWKKFFELNESLDELREAKASEAISSPLKSRLESAEKGFQEKLVGLDAQFANRSAEWDAALQGRSRHAQTGHGEAERLAESPLVHSESGSQRSEGAFVAEEL